MRMPACAAALAIAVVLPAPAFAARQLLPVQLNVAAGANHGDDGIPETQDAVAFGSLYVGTVIPLGMGAQESGFLGAGLEGTVNGYNGPYQWSIGAGSRIGRMWHLQGSPVAPFSDFYIYTRATPFFGMRSIASEEYLGETPRVSVPGGGIRLGVGFTAPRWTASMLGVMGGTGHWGSTGDASADIACCLLAIGLTLINHGELTYEAYKEPGRLIDHRIGWRIGAGF